MSFSERPESSPQSGTEHRDAMNNQPERISFEGKMNDLAPSREGANGWLIDEVQVTREASGSLVIDSTRGQWGTITVGNEAARAEKPGESTGQPNKVLVGVKRKSPIGAVLSDYIYGQWQPDGTLSSNVQITLADVNTGQAIFQAIVDSHLEAYDTFDDDAYAQLVQEGAKYHVIVRLVNLTN